MPLSLNADRMVAWVSWHVAMCLLMMWLSWCRHWYAMCVHESEIPHIGHTSVDANPYLCASVSLYNWSNMNLRRVMSSLGELHMSEWKVVSTIVVRAPCTLAFRMRRLYNEVL